MPQLRGCIRTLSPRRKAAAVTLSAGPLGAHASAGRIQLNERVFSPAKFKPAIAAPARPKQGSGRLPSPYRDGGEDRLYAVLAVLCLFVLGCEFRTLLDSAANWAGFVDFVRQLVS